MPVTGNWHSNLSAYPNKCAIKFLSTEELHHFIDLIWEDRDLIGIPHVPVGDNTIIFPQMAEQLVKDKLSNNQHFSITQVLNPSLLSRIEFTELQKERNTV